MHLALLSDRWPPDYGGLARAAARLAHGLAAQGVRVSVFVLDRGAPASERWEQPAPGLRVCRLGTQKREADSGVQLWEALLAGHARDPFDVVHGMYLVRSGFVAAYAGRYLGLPSVVGARGNDLDRALFDPGARAGILAALSLAGAVTAVSRELQRKARALAPAARVAWIPNGVDTQVFRPQPRDPERRLSWALDDCALVGFAGELRVKKGLGPLLEALALLARTRRVALLAVGGIRHEDDGMLALFRRQHPQVPVLVLEYREPHELPALYAEMDVFVHPSLRDGLPNALLEAMACARPCLATPVGGIPDVLRDGREGRLVPAGDAPALAEALGSLLDAPAHALALGRAARERVCRDFTPQAELETHVRLYRELRAGAAGPPSPSAPE